MREVTIVVDSWIMVGICIGFLIPAFLTSVVIGMGAFYMLDRYIRRTRAGTKLRKAAYRAWPNKFTGEKAQL